MDRDRLPGAEYDTAIRATWLQLADMVGDEMAESIWQQYRLDLQAAINQFSGALANAAPDLIRRAAHRLAGLLAQFGADDFARDARQIDSDTAPQDPIRLQQFLQNCRDFEAFTQAYTR